MFLTLKGKQACWISLLPYETICKASFLIILNPALLPPVVCEAISRTVSWTWEKKQNPFMKQLFQMLLLIKNSSTF